jgi:uncharacterized protein (TIGR02246 family)
VRRLFTSCLAFLVTGGAWATLAGQTAADTASVQALYSAWFGPAQQDPERYASFYAPDGYILPPNERPVQGRNAIAQWQRRTRTEATYTVRPEGIRVDEIRFLGPTWVVYRGTLWGHRVPTAGGEPTPFETKYFDVLIRTDDGEWKVAYRMWSDSR